jgi:hypothetical protein
MPAVPDGACVNRDERPLFDLAVAGDAMDDLTVERDADEGGKAVIALEV